MLTKSKNSQSTKSSRSKKRTKVSCVSEKPNVKMSTSRAKRKKLPKQNQFQFVDTNAPNADNKCSIDAKQNKKIVENNTNDTDIKEEKTEIFTKYNQDDSVFDVFADYKDSNDGCDDDDDDGYEISDNYLFIKRPKILCEICHKIFRHRSDYNIHINRLHQNKDHLYLCTRCPQTFHSASELVKHTKEHRTKRIIMCDICGILKKNKAYMDNHIQMHFDERAFICHICTASFKTKKTLCDHLKRHTGIKKYKCDQCDAAFFDCSDYKRHLFKHGGIEKEFHCSICGSSFYERKLLKYHIIKVHNICNGEELRFLPKPKDKNETRFKYLQKPTRKPKENIKKPQTKTSTPPTIEKQPKLLKKLTKPTNRKPNDLEVNSANVKMDQESIEDLKIVSNTNEIKEEAFVEDDTFHFVDAEINEFTNGNFENSNGISDTKAPSIDDDVPLNEYKHILELNAIENKCPSDESDLKNPEEIKFIDIFSKDTVCSTLHNFQESLQLINSSAESLEDFNKEKVQFIHHKIGAIVAEFHKLIQKIPKTDNDSVVRFLPLNDIDTLDQKLNDKSFNDEFTNYFETCYPQTSPHNLEDLEKILSDSFLKQYSVRGSSNRKFIDHKCLMKTLHKIWTQECKTYKEFEKLMRSQVWKVMQTYKKKHKAQQ